MSHSHALSVHASVTERLGHGLLLAGAAGSCLLMYSIDPAADDSPYPVCPFLALTGVPCPGCGSLRATNRLLHGDVGAALGYNALLVLTVPMLAYIAVRSFRIASGHHVPRATMPRWAGYTVLGVVLLFWLLRVIPAEPFSALAP